MATPRFPPITMAGQSVNPATPPPQAVHPQTTPRASGSQHPSRTPSVIPGSRVPSPDMPTLLPTQGYEWQGVPYANLDEIIAASRTTMGNDQHIQDWIIAIMNEMIKRDVTFIHNAHNEKIIKQREDFKNLQNDYNQRVFNGSCWQDDS